MIILQIGILYLRRFSSESPNEKYSVFYQNARMAQRSGGGQEGVCITAILGRVHLLLRQLWHHLMLFDSPLQEIAGKGHPED